MSAVEHSGLLPADERPLRELISRLSSDGSLLVQQEIALAKKELDEKVAKAKVEVTSIVVGGAVLYAGVLTLVAAVVLLLALAVPAWVSALIVGVLVTGVGAALSMKGKKGLEHVNMTPEKTIHSVQSDVLRVKEAVR